MRRVEEHAGLVGAGQPRVLRVARHPVEGRRCGSVAPRAGALHLRRVDIGAPGHVSFAPRTMADDKKPKIDLKSRLQRMGGPAGAPPPPAAPSRPSAPPPMSRGP